MNNITKIVCCGCGSCAQKCPVGCIEIKQNEDGFLQAVCDEKKCINCGKCLQHCPMNCEEKPTAKPIDFYAAASEDKEIYSRSSSGGVFSHLANAVLEKKGYVWGCGYAKNHSVVHKEINSKEELDDICRSKYVQSYLGDAYAKIEERLKCGAMVLFAGTPCQNAGLKKYLSAEYETLYMVDIVCHGVPSHGMFEKNISYLEGKKNKKIKRYEFRLKTGNDRKQYMCTCEYEDGEKEVKPYYKDAYFNAFYDMFSLNESCYQCPYACAERVGDITMGDYEWGKKYHEEFKEYDAISCVLVNTEKGKEMLEWLREGMKLKPTQWDYIVEKNLNLVRPTLRPKYRESLYKEIREKGYEKWADDYYKSIHYFKKMPFMKPIVKMKILMNKILK